MQKWQCLKEKKIVHELLKFASIGVIITIVSVIAYYILLDVLALPLYPVYISVYCIAVVFSYIFNAKYTFKKESNWSDYLKYFLTYFVGLLLGIGIISLLKNYTFSSNFISVLISIPIRVLFTFVLVKLSIFK